MNTTFKFSIFVLLLVFSYCSSFAQDSFSSVKTDINTVQNTNPTLPDAPNGNSQKGLIGNIVSNLFTSAGKIRNEFLDFIDPSTNTIKAESIEGLSGLANADTNKILKWGNGKLSSTDIYEDSGNVGIGAPADSNRRLSVSNIAKDTVAIRLQDNDANWFLTTTTTEGFGIHQNSTGTSGSRFNISSGGNVGIGTTTPSQKLDVSGNINFTGDLYKNGTRVNFAGKFQDASTSGNIYYNGGNVGIGTNTPTSKLTVNGNIVANTPTANNHVATKNYVDTRKATDADKLDGIDSADFLKYLGNRNQDANSYSNTGDGYTEGRPFTANHPTGLTHGTMLNIGKRTAGDVQLFVDDNGRMTTRSNSWNNIWSPWRRVFNFGDSGDNIADETIDSSEIQNETLTASDLAPNSVGNSELIDTPEVKELFITNTGYPRLEMRDTDGGQWPYIDFSNDASTDFDMRLRQSGDDELRIEGGNLRTLGNILADSRVGIGTASPSHPLDVRSPGDAVAYFSSPGNNAYIRLAIQNNPSNRIELANRNGRTALWNPNSGDAFNVVHASGNVGIGTQNPSSKLEVAGRVEADQYCDRNGQNCIVPGSGLSGNLYSCPALDSDYTYSCPSDCVGQITTNSTCLYTQHMCVSDCNGDDDQYACVPQRVACAPM